MPEKRVLLGFSGGMDSFAAAVLLKEAGYEVVCTHLVLHEPDPDVTVEHVQTLTRRLELPLIVKDIRSRFREGIILPFVETYLSGKTPNPCVWCNEQIKLQVLSDLTKEQSAQWIATGHYAKKAFDPACKRWTITRGKDPSKDQSYFLAFVSQDHLKPLLLPLGDETKEDLRTRMKAYDFPFTEQSESHDICFLKGMTFREFITGWTRAKPESKGVFIDKKGRALGTHDGFYRYTVGQRRGIGIADKTPYYVTALFPERNQVQIGKLEDLYKSTFSVTNCHWHLPPGDETLTARCQIRYRHKAAPATLRIRNENRVEVTFTRPQRAITPGQVAAFYREDRLIGAGIIESVAS